MLQRAHHVVARGARQRERAPGDAQAGADGRLVMNEPGGATVNSAVFNSAGTQVLTTSIDGNAIVWDSRSGKELTVISEGIGSEIRGAAFDPVADHIATAAATAVVSSGELAGPLSALERIAERRVTRGLTPAERRTYLAGIDG